MRNLVTAGAFLCVSGAPALRALMRRVLSEGAVFAEA
jgi:hypothetical protein